MIVEPAEIADRRLILIVLLLGVAVQVVEVEAWAHVPPLAIVTVEGIVTTILEPVGNGLWACIEKV